MVPSAGCNRNRPAGCLPRKTSLCFQPLAPAQTAHFGTGSVARSPAAVGAKEQSRARKASEGKPPGRLRGPLHFRGAPLALEAGCSSCLTPSHPLPPALKEGFAVTTLFRTVLSFDLGKLSCLLLLTPLSIVGTASPSPCGSGEAASHGAPPTHVSMPDQS